ncbi:ABC transporter permease [Acetivibrio saccincola]|uniref:ABC-2 family transporter protein n=1 Tax=Acetivibrio saccincola TaxID=1677857 RepID=A0A2K9EE86_9FIRM|nr:ABC transporter permease [Acetivibrio saccincola]AUG58464.1 ABC-2 family transporter protein [Acetivibrio saccincola]PQQ66335.1 sodium ABC transporter permease [Acetivibrio saccincola]HOA97609.1 ABC transporter permease [Acetivibrio saccincola]HQD28290.1 ABC transporter permease [Acetivibrio saccincola]
MKNKFRKWTDVYKFTLQQVFKKKGFKVVTVLVAFGIFAVAVLLNILSAKPEKDVEPSSIEKVYVLDESGFTETDYSAYLQAVDDIRFKHINFENVSNLSKQQAIEKYEENPENNLLVVVTAKDEAFEMEGILLEESSISKKEAQSLLEVMIGAFNTNKIMQVGLTQEELAMVMTPIVTLYSEVGEDTSIVVVLLKTLAPMLFSLLLYFMLLLHGLTISREVSTEKTSKLVETLITKVHPYALITGKVLAVSSAAVIQVLVWFFALLTGVFGGNAIARSVYPEYQNSVIAIIKMLRESMGEMAFSIPALILAFIIFCVGFLFFCFLAGLAGSMVSKSEDAASIQNLFQLPVVVSWLTCYIATIQEKDNILEVARYIPFTAPFSAPIDLILGKMGLINGLISAGVLILFSIGVIILSAKIYKGLILYSGQKINLRTIIDTLKN